MATLLALTFVFLTVGAQVGLRSFHLPPPTPFSVIADRLQCASEANRSAIAKSRCSVVDVLGAQCGSKLRLPPAIPLASKFNCASSVSNCLRWNRCAQDKVY